MSIFRCFHQLAFLTAGSYAYLGRTDSVGLSLRKVCIRMLLMSIKIEQLRSVEVAPLNPFHLLVLQIALKYDPQVEEDLRNWIEEVTGMSIGANFQLGLKDGIILCE